LTKDILLVLFRDSKIDKQRNDTFAYHPFLRSDCRSSEHAGRRRVSAILCFRRSAQ
jgi:hypothetical protein